MKERKVGEILWSPRGEGGIISPWPLGPRKGQYLCPNGTSKSRVGRKKKEQGMASMTCGALKKEKGGGAWKLLRGGGGNRFELQPDQKVLQEKKGGKLVAREKKKELGSQ